MPRHTLDTCIAVNGMALDRKLDTIATPDVTQNQHNGGCLLLAWQTVPEQDRTRAREMDEQSDEKIKTMRGERGRRGEHEKERERDLGKGEKLRRWRMDIYYTVRLF